MAPPLRVAPGLQSDAGYSKPHSQLDHVDLLAQTAGHLITIQNLSIVHARPSGSDTYIFYFCFILAVDHWGRTPIVLALLAVLAVLTNTNSPSGSSNSSSSSKHQQF